MTDKIQEIRITPETARKALYELDGPIASDEGMIIENALTLWEEERALLDAAKQENERLTFELDVQLSAKQTAVDVSFDSLNKCDSLQQQLKQAIEGLEVVKIQIDAGQLDFALADIDETLSLIREEANRPQGHQSTEYA